MSGLPVKGWVRIWQDDSLVAEGKNRVVADGLKLLAERLDDGTTALPSLFKLGDSAAGTQEGMTALQGNEVGQLAATRVRRENILTWSGELTVSGSGSKVCKEVGLFQADGDGGRMLARFLPLQQFTVKNGTHIRINWEITIGE